MKICILTALLNHGGASIVALDVAKGMAEQGHDVLFVCSGTDAKVFSRDGFKIRIIGSKFRTPLFHYFNPFLITALFRVLQSFKPDIIHVHNINLQTFSLCALLFSRLYPMVWTLHDIWPLCMVGWPEPPDCNGLIDRCRECSNWPQIFVRTNRLLKETVYRHSKISIVCPSGWMSEQLHGSALSQNNVHIVHNGFDPHFFSDSASKIELKSQLGIPKNSPIVLFIGGKRLAGLLPAERKGWKYLVSALKKNDLKKYDIHLLYVGDRIDLPSDFPVSVSFAQGISRSDMNLYYSLADIFVLPTLADNSPLTILEAMTNKTPVIAAKTGGIPEIVIHNETGILCPPRNSSALTEAIELLLSKPEIGSELAERAHEHIFSEFSFNQMITGYEAVYNQTIAKSR